MSAGWRLSLGTIWYAVVAIALASGLALIATGSWRMGAGLCGGSMLAAGIGRLVIPDRMSGLLRVRRRTTDALLMLALGGGLVTLAVLIRRQP